MDFDKKYLLFVLSLLVPAQIRAAFEGSKPIRTLNATVIVDDVRSVRPYGENPEIGHIFFRDALSQQVSPIVVSSSVVHELFVRRKTWNENLKAEKERERRTMRYTKRVKRFGEKLPLTIRDRFMRSFWNRDESPNAYLENYLSAYALKLDDTDWWVYRDATGEWYLFIPKKYQEKVEKEWKSLEVGKQLEQYKKNLTISASKATGKEKLELEKEIGEIAKQQAVLADPRKKMAIMVGFNVDNPKLLKPVTIKEMQEKPESIKINRTVNMSALQKLFVTRKRGALGGWLFFLFGHGVGAKVKPERIALEREDSELELISQDASSGWNKDLMNKANQNLRVISSIIGKKIEPLIPKMGPDEIKSLIEATQKMVDAWRTEQDKGTIAELALIKEGDVAGMSTAQYRNFLKFLAKDIHTSFLYYTTCYGGGYNLSLPYFEFLKKHDAGLKKEQIKGMKALPINYIIASGATADAEITEFKSSFHLLNPHFVLPFSRRWPALGDVFAMVNYVDFFDSLQKFFRGKLGTAPSGPELLIHALRSTHISIHASGAPTWMALTSAVSLRFPGTRFFRALATSRDFEIITHVRAMAAEHGGKPIVVKDREAILLYPAIMRTPLMIKKGKWGEFPLLISMYPGVGLHILEKVVIDTDLNTFLSRLKIPLEVPKFFFFRTLSTKEKEYKNVVVAVDSGKVTATLGRKATLLNEFIRFSKAYVQSPLEAPWLQDDWALYHYAVNLMLGKPVEDIRQKKIGEILKPEHREEVRKRLKMPAVPAPKPAAKEPAVSTPVAPKEPEKAPEDFLLPTSTPGAKKPGEDEELEGLLAG